jgi:hypothetical protein
MTRKAANGAGEKDGEKPAGRRPPDRRTNAWRSDLAAESLRGLVDAPRYARGKPGRVTAAIARLHRGPDHDMPVDSELIYGDEVVIYDEEGMWAWVQNRRDDYVGYIPRGCLAKEPRRPTHRISALATYAYGQPSIKTPLPYRMFLNSKVEVREEVGDFMRIADGRFIHKAHLSELDEVADDFVSVAERHVGAPYLWGGRTADGIDCSGLVQASMECAGLACPRDSDMQRGQGGQVGLEGEKLDLGGMEELRRGDLVFWPGHVAIMVDDSLLVHANAASMDVRVESFHMVCARIAASGDGDIEAILRPRVLSAAQA